MTCVPPSHPLYGCWGIANVLLLKTLSEVSHDTIPGVNNPSRKTPQVLYHTCVFAGVLVLKRHPRRPEAHHLVNQECVKYSKQPGKADSSPRCQNPRSVSTHGSQLKLQLSFEMFLAAPTSG